MSKTLKLISTLFLTIAIAFAFVFWDSTMNSPTNFKVTYLNETNEKIPENFKGLKILYFSDLCYGTIFDKTHLSKLENTISTIDYDFVIFGGDLFDKDYSAVSDDVNLLTDFFRNLDGRLGKFYILGDYDQVSDTRSVLAKKVLGDANFEQINGEMKLYNGLSGHITISADPTIETNPEVFNINVIHDTNNYDKDNASFDLVLLGNSHIRQVDPFVAMQYGLGKNGNLYRVRSVGLTENNYRIFNTPEILLIRF